VKQQYPFNADTYLGYRGPDELIDVTGTGIPRHACSQQRQSPSDRSAACSGNKLWEWFSLGHYGLGGYDAKAQSFKGAAWPKVCRPRTPSCRP
jgi:hypothetical protein